MNAFYRWKNFFRKSWRDKAISIRFNFRSLWLRSFSAIPFPIRLPYGGWWLATNDPCSEAIFRDKFEEGEWRFVGRFLQERMTVLDIGAHHGFYTILASKRVGPSGRIIAFEPSPRERRRLSFHIRLNHCRNVKIEPFALSNEEGETTLFLADRRDALLNSLRPPAVSRPIRRIVVQTITLDRYLEKERIDRVDFIKIDAEGAELEILKGMEVLFKQNSSPVIMAEVSDTRTQSWGYPAGAIYAHLAERGYDSFTLTREGMLQPMYKEAGLYNYIAVPRGKMGELKKLWQPAGVFIDGP
jgi:FkbM family methyltransferase